jgi:hypothetical protein
MYKRDIWQSDDDKVCLVNKTMDPNNKRNNLLFKLLGHSRLVALEHVTIITSNADQLLTKLL